MNDASPATGLRYDAPNAMHAAVEVAPLEAAVERRRPGTAAARVRPDRPTASRADRRCRGRRPRPGELRVHPGDERAVRGAGVEHRAAEHLRDPAAPTPPSPRARARRPSARGGAAAVVPWRRRGVARPRPPADRASATRPPRPRAAAPRADPLELPSGRGHPTWRVWPSQYGARSLNFWSLPVAVRASSSRNSTLVGHLKCASRPRQCSISSASVDVGTGRAAPRAPSPSRPTSRRARR